LSNLHPPFMQRAALRPSVPAGAQIAFAPVQSRALVQASAAHTFVEMMAGPPHVGSMVPRMHFRGGLASAAQSELLQHWPGGVEQVVASGTFTAQTR
jgi:hypothetical protein